MNQKQRKRYRDKLDSIATDIARERTGGLCEVRLSPDCNGQGCEVHHGAKKKTNAQRYFLEAHVYTCRPCHSILGDTATNKEFMIGKIGKETWEKAVWLRNVHKVTLSEVEEELNEYKRHDK